MDNSTSEMIYRTNWSDLQNVEIWIHFPDAHSAEYLVAGIPAAARVIQAIVWATGRKPSICSVASGEWQVSKKCLDESKRLAQCAPYDLLPQGTSSSDVVALDGLLILTTLARNPKSWDCADPSQLAKYEWTGSALSFDVKKRKVLLHEASLSFLKATAKDDDGLVSRYLNRPLSRSISSLLLKLPAVRPVHATAGTAILAAMMFAALILGGEAGAIAGALMFHAASVFDGVDGEIARATHRTSASGARLDSLIDGATNLAFLSGLSFNLFARGQGAAALEGFVGVLALAVGLWQIGSRSRALGQPINFEAVKVYLRQGRPKSLLKELLIWLTMRDFIAAACASAVVLGFAAETLFVFMLGASIWLIAASFVLARTGIRAKRSMPTR